MQLAEKTFDVKDKLMRNVCCVICPYSASHSVESLDSVYLWHLMDLAAFSARKSAKSQSHRLDLGNVQFLQRSVIQFVNSCPNRSHPIDGQGLSLLPLCSASSLAICCTKLLIYFPWFRLAFCSCLGRVLLIKPS